MAPQHRRGGKHAVKDEDLTHTKYDDYNREQLLAAVKEAGCYVKDDKKSVMARKLAEHDRDKQYEASRAAQERKEKEAARQQQIAYAAQTQRDRRAARTKRNQERTTRYERGEEVSSNSSDTASDPSRCAAREQTVTGGLALSDETWEDTCSETTIRSENAPVRPACRLQLFEWPYSHPPPSSQPSDLNHEQHPALLTYAPLKLVTTLTHEKITLPGKAYPAGVDPDYVPHLDALTRAAARHGHLLNHLSRAVIEPASVWARRTTVQGWNARIYFSLPAQSQYETKHGDTLDEVYRRHRVAHRRLLHPTPGAMHGRADRQARFKQMATLKRRRVADVYEASLWKPMAVGYLPAYLDWETGERIDFINDEDKTVENLWYVRFPGCDVPHYYFWSLAGGCSNPSVPDPGWCVDEYLMSRRVRVRKLTAPPKLIEQSIGSQLLSFGDTLELVEESLVHHGLAVTLARYRAHALAADKAQAWTIFSRPLLGKYPSGAIPRAPPVQTTDGFCIAAKIALLLDGQDVAPYTGEESWTRNDDSFWAVVSAPGRENVSAVHEANLPSTQNPRSIAHPAPDQVTALHRRDSSAALPLRTFEVHKHIWTWLDAIASTFPPPDTPLSAQPISGADPLAPPNLTEPETTSTCPFCSLPWTNTPAGEKAAHMLSHSHISPAPLTATFVRDAVGQGVKRRHSLLTQRTLQGYQTKFGRAGDVVRGDAGRGLASSFGNSLAESVRGCVGGAFVAGSWVQRERSPFSKDRRREGVMRGLQGGCGEGRGGRGWMLGRAPSEWGSEDWDVEELDVEGDECGESVWFADNET